MGRHQFSNQLRRSGIHEPGYRVGSRAETDSGIRPTATRIGQSGQLMSAAALLAKKPKPTDSDIDAASGNLSVPPSVAEQLGHALVLCAWEVQSPL